jgi:hypothetical protein
MTDEEFHLWHEFASDELIEQIRDIEIEYEKIQRKEEREREKERVKAEKQKEKEYLKELKKPKEDLDIDKQAELPIPVEIRTIIPSHLFGDALMITEFLKCYGDVFDLHVDFPNGFTLGSYLAWRLLGFPCAKFIFLNIQESLEDALFSKSSSSALCNLLLFFLDSILKCDEEENLENSNDASDDEPASNGLTNADAHVESEDDENISIEQLHHKSLSGSIERENFLKLAEKYTKLIRSTQGRSFRTIGLDVYTISVMLRLYFLTSGSKYNAKMKYWYHQRGGFTVADDIGVEFSMYESVILSKLESNNVFELEPCI